MTGWTRAERLRLAGIGSVIAVLHVAGWTGYLYYARSLPNAGTFAGAGTLAYTLGMRHAFDADHISAIDDTTRLLLSRGKRPLGVGFFFSLGHATIVLVLAVLVGVAARAATAARVESFRHVGTVLAVAVSASFLLLVAVLNGAVLRDVVRLWRELTAGRCDEAELEARLLGRGVLNRLLGGRARRLVTASWHMYVVGLLFGLGLETATEVTVLALSASAATSGTLLAVLTLPLLFAAGMSALDTADSLVMTRAYSWAFRSAGRRLYYNITTTSLTVAVAVGIALLELAGLAVAHWQLTGGVWSGVAMLTANFELLGYCIVGLFVLTWLGAVAFWRLSGWSRRYGTDLGGAA